MFTFWENICSTNVAYVSLVFSSRTKWRSVLYFISHKAPPARPADDNRRTKTNLLQLFPNFINLLCSQQDASLDKIHNLNIINILFIKSERFARLGLRAKASPNQRNPMGNMSTYDGLKTPPVHFVTESWKTETGRTLCFPPV